MKKVISSCFAGAFAILCGCADVNEKHFAMYQEYIDCIKSWDEPQELASMPTMNWQSNCNYKIVYSSKEIVSFRIESHSYSGGAHGMTHTRVGSIKSGRILKLSDLPRNIEPLWQKAVAERFKKSSFEEYLKSKPTFEPRMTENFYLDRNGVHFIYDPYEIDCYAAGIVDIFVPCRIE